MFNCNKVKEIMSLYIDDELDNTQKKEFEKHIQYCDSCKKEFEELKNIIVNINSLPQEELPDNFHSDLMLLLNYESKKKNKINWIQYSTIAACAITLLLVFNISKIENKPTENLQAQYAQDSPMLRSAVINDNDIESYDTPAIPYELHADTKNSKNIAVPEKADTLYDMEESNISRDKLEILKFNMTIETNDFDNTLNAIYNILPQIDSKNITENNSLKNLYIYSKIEINSFENVVENLKQINGVKNSSITSENKTDEYINIKSQLEKELPNESIEILNKNLSDIEYLADYPQITINLIEK